MNIGIGIASLLMLFGLASAPAELPVPVNSQTYCELHVFKGGTLNSASPSALVYGIIPALIEGERERKFPSGDVEAQMEIALSPTAVLDIVETMPWREFLGVERVTTTMEDDLLTKSDIRARVKTGRRNTPSTESCYLELYVSQQDFTGSFIKSHLYSHFTLIDFRTDRPDVKRAIVWSRSRDFPAQDEASFPIATEALRNSFSENLRKFLAKKFKS